MDAGTPRLSVLRSPAAVDELYDIWRWNAGRYGIAHADAYLRFITDHIEDLCTTYNRGRIVTGRPDLRYKIVQRRRRGHGHVVVYSVTATHVLVLHVFHTARNWASDLADEAG